MTGRKRRPKSNRAAFLNVPYDETYENLYLAFIAGLCGFGLIPRATIEISGSRRRLERILGLIRRCRYSFHDLSRVELDSTPPVTPRFNMPFELGIAIATSQQRRGTHTWFVFESHAYRLKKSLSDLDGTDPLIHDSDPIGVLTALADGFSRSRNRPALSELKQIYSDLCTAAERIKSERNNPSLFGARVFKDLVFAARTSAASRIVSLQKVAISRTLQ